MTRCWVPLPLGGFLPYLRLCPGLRYQPRSRNTYDSENINGGGPEDTSLAKACRGFDRYKFGELMEDSLWTKHTPFMPSLLLLLFHLC